LNAEEADSAIDLTASKSVEDHVLLGCRELGVALDDLVDGIHEIFFGNGLSSGPDCEHARLCANTANVGTCSVRAHASNQLEPNVLVEGHGLSVDLEDLDSSFKVRKPKLDLSIETTWSSQSRVESIRAVSRHENFDVAS